MEEGANALGTGAEEAAARGAGRATAGAAGKRLGAAAAVEGPRLAEEDDEEEDELLETLLRKGTAPAGSGGRRAAAAGDRVLLMLLEAVGVAGRAWGRMATPARPATVTAAAAVAGAAVAGAAVGATTGAGAAAAGGAATVGTCWATAVFGLDAGDRRAALGKMPLDAKACKAAATAPGGQTLRGGVGVLALVPRAVESEDEEGVVGAAEVFLLVGVVVIAALATGVAMRLVDTGEGGPSVTEPALARASSPAVASLRRRGVEACDLADCTSFL